jgi:hypothetical protein
MDGTGVKIRHTLCSIPFFFSFSKIMMFMDDVGKCGIRRLRIACWVTKAKTHTQNM